MEILRRLAWLFQRRRLERELAEELAFHREQMSAGRRRSFGEELRLREAAREVWGWGWLDRLAIDLRYGARVLRRSPGFTLTAMIVLALGIGVPLAAFRVVAAELAGGSAPEPESLVRLTARAPGAHRTAVSVPELEFYAEHAKSFRNLVGVSERNPALFDETAGGELAERGEPIQVAFVTASYFAEFGIAPALGRRLTADDERADAEPVALVGESFWRRRLGADPAVLGRSLRVNGKPLRVVGVAPRSAAIRDDLWLPLVRQPYLVEGSALLTDWSAGLELYGRLRPGVSRQAAEAESLALAVRLGERRPGPAVPGEYLAARSIGELDPESDQLRTMLTAATLVLLLLVAASANLGILVLARGATREREIRVRLALGATRRRVARQLFTESLLLAATSGLGALLLGTVVLAGIRARFDAAVSLVPDARALAATFAAAVVAALVFGLPPALRLSRLVPGAGRSRTIFLGAQVAASCLLLVVSSLLVRTVERLGVADPGFDHRHLVAISPGLDRHGYGEAAATQLLDELGARVAAAPGVRAVSRAWIAPWSNLHFLAEHAERSYSGNEVDPRFLETTGIALVRGRNLGAGETGVALVNEAAARALWPAEEALGQTLPWSATSQRVVGVVSDASTAFVGLPESREFYLSTAAAHAPGSVLLVRVAGTPRDFVRRFEQAALDLDPRLQPAIDVLSDAHDREVRGVTTALAVIATLGTVALLLSIVGLAGLAGYLVAQRTREIGVRMALGARASQIVGALLAPLGRPIVAGFLVGALGGTAVAVLLRSGIPALAGLRVADPYPYLMAMAAFGAVVGLSILEPGRRALRIDPSRALQHE